MHKASKHNIGVKWYECPHCDYKAKEICSITSHKVNVHNIGVQWTMCPHLRLQGKGERQPQQAHQEEAHVQVRNSVHRLLYVALQRTASILFSNINSSSTLHLTAATGNEVNHEMQQIVLNVTANESPCSTRTPRQA